MSEERIKELETKLSQYKAHVERLKHAAGRALESACDPYACGEDLVEYIQGIIDQEPATSLAQVEAEAISIQTRSLIVGEFLNRLDDEIGNIGGLKKYESSLWQCISEAARRTSNNLKEKG